jgi:Flp pilus assembly pilin Flp
VARDRLVRSLRRDEGQAFVEYALVLLIIAVAVAGLTVWGPFRTAIGNAIDAVSTAIGDNTPG